METNSVDPAGRFADLPVLMTKLHMPPPGVARTMPRPRLIERLDASFRAGPTLLCAPAGFGKSTLLQHWAEQAAERPAWLSVDRADNDIVRFWYYIIRAIDVVRPGFLERTGDVVKQIYPSKYECALTLLHDELRRFDRPITLVIDDFHTLTDDELLASFAYFFERVPDRLQLILACRTPPVLPVAHSCRPLVRIGADELRFTPQEGGDFFAGCTTLALSGEEAARWVDRTEGWVTAMKLAAISSQAMPPASRPADPVSGGFPLLEQYLWEEVLSRQNEPIRRFLLNCSVLKRMTASLCEAVGGGGAGQAMLERLERAQLFVIPLDERGQWYRFHHLFAEFLSRRLERTEPERMRQLLAAAGQWCEREGWKEEALDYYLRGKHYDRAIRLLEEMTTKVFRADQRWMGGQLALIPEALLLSRPALYFSYVYFLLVGDNDYVQVERMMRYAERTFERGAAEWTVDERNEFGASYYFLKILYELVVRGDWAKGAECLRQARQYRPARLRLVFTQSKGSGLPSVQKEHTLRDKLIPKEALLPFMQHLIEMLEEAGLAAPVVACLAEWHYEYDELDEAEMYARTVAESAADLHRSYTMPESLLPARIVLSRVQRIRGRRADAKATLQAARRDIIELGLTRALIYCDAELASLALEEGDAAPADDWMRRYRPDEDGDIGSGQLYECIYMAKWMMKREKYESARRLTDRMRAAAGRDGRLYIQAEIELMHLALLHGEGRTDEALLQLRQLLSTTEPGGFIRLYLDGGEPIACLLTLLLQPPAQEKNDPLAGYVRRLLRGFGRDILPDDADLAAALTRKELEILRLIARRMSNRQIADKLGISPGTVKSHINNIYSKLYVKNRSEAIARGEQLGW